MARPIIGITMGDAAGVGPEIIMKALAVPETYEISRPLVIGDARRLRKAGEIVGSKLSVRPIQKPEEAAFRRGGVEGVGLSILPEGLPFRKLSATAGGRPGQIIPPRRRPGHARARGRLLSPAL